MNRELLKNVLAYLGIIVLFLGLSYGFVPEVLDGQIVNQHDISGWKGMAQEAIEHNQANPDDPTAWTNSMFGGMPTTAIVDDFEGDWTKPIYTTLMWGKRPATYLFIALLGGFLLMMSLGVRKLIAIGGAIAIAFCSYNMQIIQVGHNTKMQAIAFLPWVLAGIIYTYRVALGGKRFLDFDQNDTPENSLGWKEWLPKTILGAVLFALALSMQIKANHIQITYYLAIIIFAFAIGLFVFLYAKHREKLKRFFAASGLLLAVGILGIATNANKLVPTYEYTPYTMRGGSELSAKSDTHNEKGLNLEYATQWSYGIEEMPNLMIPNYNGGSSHGPLEEDSQTGELLKDYGYRGRELDNTLQNMPLYWGPQPFTAGPMYMGAITAFLFILGALLCKGREKWWLIAASVVAIFLAWGNHFMWFTELWFNYAPFYNKFRTVSMALVVLQVTLPMLGFYALDKILRENYEKKALIRKGAIAFAVTGGFCLLCAILPGIAGDFAGQFDSEMNSELAKSLAADRADIMQSDAWKSFMMIALAAALIYWAWSQIGKSKEEKGKNKIINIAAGVMAVLVLFDLWGVGKRYLNEDHFITPKNFEAQYVPREVDKILFEDKDPDFRVLDLSINTFNSSITSYHHKTIGGYSAVKMQRYQDLIDRYIVKEINIVGNCETFQELYDKMPELKITSMLNGKYIILNGDYAPIENQYASGHAWFVDSFIPAETADEEIDFIGVADLTSEAVIGKDFEWARNAIDDLALAAPSDSSAHANDLIELVHYAPNELRYTYNSSSARPVVFSEIYYPDGWKAWIEPAGSYGKVVDGHYQPTPQAKPLDLFRANWILRAAIIPEGEGEIVMRFEPDSYQTGANISLASSITLLLLLILSIGGIVVISRKSDC